MADLGSLVLKITANPQSFEAGIASTARRLEQFGTQAANVFANLETAMNVLSANPAMALLAVIVKVKDAASDAWKELTKLVAEGTRAASAQARLSSRFGISGAAAGGLMHQGNMLGIDPDSMRASMTAFSVRLSETAMHGGAAAAALGRLGLDARALTQVPLDQAMGQIGDALGTVTNRGERNALMWEILGRRGSELEPLFARGSAAMAEAAQQAQRWGLTFSEADAQAVRSAQIAQRGAESALGSIRQAIANALAVAAAPVIQFGSGLVTQFVDFFQSGAGLAIRETIADVGKIAIDVIGGIKAGFADMKPVIDALKHVFTESFKLIKEAFGDSSKMGDTWKLVGQFIATLVVPYLGVATLLIAGIAGVVWVVGQHFQFIATVVSGIVDFLKGAVAEARTLAGLTNAVQGVAGGGFGAAAAAALGQGGGGAGAQTGMAAAQQWPAVFNEIGKATTQATQAMQNFGLSAGQAQIANLQRDVEGIGNGFADVAHRLIFGVNPTMEAHNQLLRDQANARLDVLRGLERQNELMQQARQIMESNVTPAERFGTQLGQAMRLFQSGSLDAEQFRRQAARLFGDLDRAQGAGQAQLAQGVTANSAAAISLLNQATANDQGNTAEERAAALLDQLVQYQQNDVGMQRRVNQAIVNGQVFRTVELRR